MTTVGPGAVDAAPGRVSASVTALLVMLGLLGLVACGQPRLEHVDLAGPLSASLGEGGGVSLDAPDYAPWYASFGGHLLCVLNGDAAVEIQDVRYLTSQVAPPLDVAVMVRRVPPDDQEDPFYSAKGRPPDIDEEFGPLRGEFHQEVAGVVVTEPCTVVGAGGGSSGFTELIFVLTVDAAGGHLEGSEIDYRVGGRLYTLVLDWEMTACGQRVLELDHGQQLCRGG